MGVGSKQKADLPGKVAKPRADDPPSNQDPRAPGADSLERFERATAWPMLVLAIAIIPLLVIPLTADLSRSTEETFIALEWFIWAAFAAEYLVRLYLAPDKWAFVKSNKIDLFVVVVPFLRPLRIARSARALRVLRAARAGVFLVRGVKALRYVLTRHKLHYVLLVTLFVVVASALLVLSFERDVAGSNIASLPDALWWAMTTVTTVGYGDRFPTTAGGRGIGVVLMVIGIALFGFLAGSIASFFVESDEEQKLDPQLAEINERLARVEDLLGGKESK